MKSDRKCLFSVDRNSEGKLDALKVGYLFMFQF